MASSEGPRAALIGSESAPLLDQVVQTIAVLAGAAAIVAVLFLCGRWLTRKTNV